MTKRLFGFILSVCLLLTSLPVAALPTSDPLPQNEELWAYERKEDGVTLTDYLGTDAHKEREFAAFESFQKVIDMLELSEDDKFQITAR